MKPYYLKEILTYKESNCTEVQTMIETTSERSILLPCGVRGIIIGATVLAPFYHNKTIVAQKDNKDIVLTFKETNRWGLAVLNLPFNIPCEPLSFRHTKIHKDTFLFWVFDYVTMCRGFSMEEIQGKFEISHPNHFCPVFDRFGHIIGICAGVFRGERVCIPIQALL